MKKFLTAVLMSVSLSCTWRPLQPVKAMESMPEVFTEEANRILSNGFCDEVKETGNKLLIPKDYMDEKFNSVMYKLVGMEMDYFESVPYEIWDEMVADTTDEIMNRCRNILPYGSIIGNWNCSQDYGNGAKISGTISYSADGIFVQHGIYAGPNPEDDTVARISFKINGDYVIKHGLNYYIGMTMRNIKMHDISRNSSNFSKTILSRMEDSLNASQGELQPGKFTLFLANRYEQGDVICVSE